MSAVPDSQVGVASGVNNAVARCAALLAVAVFGAIAFSAFDRSLERRIAASPLPPAARAAILAEPEKLVGGPLPETLRGGERQAAEAAIAGAIVDSFRLVMVLAAALALAGAACAAATIPREMPARPGA
jgi:hypothetical protein